MRVITKLDSSCVGLTTFPTNNRIYAASELGTITTIKEEEIGAKYRNPDGCRNLQVTRGGTRLVYMDNTRKTMFWRDIRPSGVSPEAGHFETHSQDTVVAAGLNSRILTAAIIKDIGYSHFRFGEPGRRANQIEVRHTQRITGDPLITNVCMFGGPPELDANDTFDSFAAISWSKFITLARVTFNGKSDPIGSDLNIGGVLRVAVRTLSNVLYGAIDDGRLMRLPINMTNPHAIMAPDYVRVPGDPTITCMDLSPCGRFLAVGANYDDEYGGVLLYDADLKPIAMYDTTFEPNAVLFKLNSTLDNSPDRVDNSNALTLYSGHNNGQIIKWYIGRQLEWLSLIESRSSSVARGFSSAASPDAVIFQRGLDI